MALRLFTKKTWQSLRRHSLLITRRRPRSLRELVFSRRLNILVLAPDPDDFDATGLGLRHPHRESHALHGLNQCRRSSSPPT
jgi:hypothetical protein